MHNIQTSESSPKGKDDGLSAHGSPKRLDQLPSETLQNIIGYVSQHLYTSALPC